MSNPENDHKMLVDHDDLLWKRRNGKEGLVSEVSLLSGKMKIIIGILSAAFVALSTQIVLTYASLQVQKRVVAISLENRDNSEDSRRMLRDDVVPELMEQR